MFIRQVWKVRQKSEGETQEMFDVITMALAGLGGASLFAALLDYRLSRKRKAEAKAHA
jgi:hypothetical protein